LENKALQTENLPNNVFVFNINLHDKKYLQNPSLLLKEIARFPSLHKYFQASHNTFSSVYVKDALTKSFNAEVLKTIQQKGFQLFQLPLRSFSFERVKNLKQATNQSVLCVAEVSMRDLANLDHIFHNSFSSFGISSRNNFLVVLKFTDVSDNVAADLLNLSGRVLEGEETPAPENPETPAPTTPKATSEIGISPAGFSGFITAILLAIALYTCNQFLNEIRTPTRFSKEPLVIGKEQL